MPLTARDEYQEALRKGRKQYSSRIIRGKPGFILSLEDISSQMDIVSEEDAGYEKVPLNRIIGTWSRSRATMFTKDFLPLATSDKSEFAVKWCELYKAQVEDGIRDPVKLYEYMNWYYVIEGNKRISVLNYLEAVSVDAKVIRLLPGRRPMTPEKQAYFDFLDFRRETGIRDIWITRPGGYSVLLEKMNAFHPPAEKVLTNRNNYILQNIYRPFRELFHTMDEQKKLRMSTGDAFLRFIEIFQMPEEFDPRKNRKRIKRLIGELILEEASHSTDADTEEIRRKKGGIGQIYSILKKQKKSLNIVFLYARMQEKSGWVYAHEMGRQYIQEKLAGRIRTTTVTGVPENDSAYEIIAREIGNGADVIFATSPYFENAVLKASLEFPRTYFYCCSPGKSHHRVKTYFGQSFESSFLAGVLAALTNREGKISYIATGSGVELYSRINSFVQGVRIINPDCRIPLLWNNYWDYPAYCRLLARSLHKRQGGIIFQHSLPVPGNDTGEYGLYDFTGERGKTVRHYGATLWHWGSLYLRIIENILSASSDGFRQVSGLSVPENFWGGLRSGTVDFTVNPEIVPYKTRQMISLMRENLINRQIHPFEGPVYDNSGKLRIPEGNQANLKDIRKMNWLCEGVDDLSGEVSPDLLIKEP